MLPNLKIFLDGMQILQTLFASERNISKPATSGSSSASNLLQLIELKLSLYSFSYDFQHEAIFNNNLLLLMSTEGSQYSGMYYTE